jgi:hypothetical protein
MQRGEPPAPPRPGAIQPRRAQPSSSAPRALQIARALSAQLQVLHGARAPESSARAALSAHRDSGVTRAATAGSPSLSLAATSHARERAGSHASLRRRFDELHAQPGMGAGCSDDRSSSRAGVDEIGRQPSLARAPGTTRVHATEREWRERLAPRRAPTICSALLR